MGLWDKAKRALARTYLEKARKKMAAGNYKGAVWALAVVVNVCYFAIRKGPPTFNLDPSLDIANPDHLLGEQHRARRLMRKLRSYSEYLVYYSTACSHLILCHMELGEISEALKKFQHLESINPEMAEDLLKEMHRRLPSPYFS